MTILPGFSISESTQESLYESGNTHVFRAVKTDDNQAVILKTTSNAHPSSNEVARYRHEYRILKSFKSQGMKNVINVIDLIMHDHRPYLVLEDFGGVDLKVLQKSNNLEIERILRLKPPQRLARFTRLKLST